jgi:hypothetical protein
LANDCPSPIELLLAAFELDAAAEGAAVGEHLTRCPACRTEVEELRETARALRTTPPGGPPASGACLDELDIAVLLDGADLDRDRPLMEHAVACAACRAQLAGTMRVLADPTVARNMERLEAGARRMPQRMPRRFGLAVVGGLAAAVLATVLLGPWLMGPERALPGEGETEIYRERTITTTAAPRILGPLGAASPSDSLTWTSVPRADLYRVSVWDRDGSLAWEGQTRDTVLALPPALSAGGDRSLLWDVKARTGWDRWVASDLAELTITEPGRVRP